jgi:hypothetical protein
MPLGTILVIVYLIAMTKKKSVTFVALVSSLCSSLEFFSTVSQRVKTAGGG